MNDQKDQKKPQKYNPLYDPATDNAAISDETQQAVNNPIEDPTGMDGDDQMLVNMIVNLIDEGKINLYQPSSLINQEVYDGLDDEKKGRVDQQAFNMLSTVREVYNYNQSDFTNNSYQFQNTVQKLREQKEQTENEIGDVYVF